MGVSDVVDANRLHAGELAAALHFVGQVGLRVREQPVVGLQAIALCDVVFETILQALRNRDHAVTLGRLGCGDDALATDPLVALVDRIRSKKVCIRRRCQGLDR